MSAMVLAARMSFHYASGYSYMDEWADIGTYRHVHQKSRNVDQGNDERRDIHIVCVESTHSPEVIATALEDEFSGSSCTHEYDCCGCRSYYADVKRINGMFYAVQRHSSRNW